MKERCGAPLLGLAKSIYYHLLMIHNSFDSGDHFRSGCRPSQIVLYQDYTHLDDHTSRNYEVKSVLQELCSDGCRRKIAKCRVN